MGEIADALRQADQAATHNKPAPSEQRSAAVVESNPRRESPRATAPLRDRDTSSQAAAAEPPAPAAPPLDLEKRDHVKWRPAHVAFSESHGEAAQQYRRLAFRIRDLADTRSARSIIVTSAEMGDGKTTTACNLAIQLVRLDQNLRVVLVDLDLRRASIAAAFGIETKASIAEVLSGDQTLDDAILETNVHGLSMLLLSQPVKDPEWLLARPNLLATIRELERRFDFVVIDTPPVLAVSDAQVILRHASAGLFVARAGRTRVKAIRNALEHIPSRKLLGSFLNSSPRTDGTGGYAYYGEASRSESGRQEGRGEARGDAPPTNLAGDAADGR